MKVDKELLKKHHFWILFAPFLVFVLVAVFTLWSGIGGKIEAREKAIKTEETAAKGKTDIKPIAELTLLNKENARVALIRYDKWRENWNLQLGVDEYFGEDRLEMKQARANQFRWPNSDLLTDFNYTPDGYTDAEKLEDKKPKFKGLKFGVEIPNTRSERLAFKNREVYLAEYSNAEPTKPGSGTGMADRLYPTQFAGGWSAVLRHVYAADAAAGYGWGQGRPSSNEIWLALEDLWVQRSLLNSLQGVNDRMAAFTETVMVNGHQTFQNRTWQVELWSVTRASDNKRVLVGTLTNLTPRIQTFGLGGKLAFKVQLEGGGPPVDLVFNERYLTGKGGTKRKQEGAEEKDVAGDTLTITPEKGADLSQVGAAVKVTAIRQTFDTRTVPIQRIDKLVLGYPDSRLAGMKPQTPKFVVVEEAAPTTGDGTTPPGPMGPMGPSSSSTGSSDQRGGPSGPGASGGVGSGWPVVYGPVTSKVLFDSTKNRYIQVTDHVRRMPVGMVLVIDQSNLQDVLMAMANSPLRFQITQVHWQRFRGTIAGSDGGTGSPESRPGPGSSSSGPAIYGSPDSGGAGPGIRFNPRRPGPGGTSPMGPMPGPGPMGPGGLGGEDGGIADADMQMTSGLIELTVYGIVSLYEKYEPEQAQPTTNP